MEHDRLVLVLRAERKVLGLTQLEIAQAIGQDSHQSVYCWETGRTVPMLSNFVAWADALGFEVRLVRREAGL